MNKVCFCGITEHCGYQIETDMEQHDKIIHEQGYNKAIDDFVNAVIKKFPDDINGITNIKIIATQLKVGGTDGTSTTNN